MIYTYNVILQRWENPGSIDNNNNHHHYHQNNSHIIIIYDFIYYPTLLRKRHTTNLGHVHRIWDRQCNFCKSFVNSNPYIYVYYMHGVCLVPSNIFHVVLVMRQPIQMVHHDHMYRKPHNIIIMNRNVLHNYVFSNWQNITQVITLKLYCCLVCNAWFQECIRSYVTSHVSW